jgi:hypothetical protein
MIYQLLKKWYFSYQVWKYSNKIPFLIMREYGPAPSYSAEHIRSIITKWKFSKKYEIIAFAILSEEQVFESVYGKNRSDSYLKIRKEIANKNFNGDTSFTICDLLSKSYYMGGAIHKSTPLPAEWKADRSFFDCLNDCRENKLFKLKSNDL